MNSATPYPILANSSDFENVAQVEKVNTIVKGQYNHYLEKTVQKKDRPTRKNNIIRSASNNVASYSDLNYGDFCCITMDFSTSGMGDYDTVYPVLKIKEGYRPILAGVKPFIVFTGVDKDENYHKTLNDNGIFDFTYNRITREQQISFRTLTKSQMTYIDENGNVVVQPIDQTGWRVTMYFFYHLKESI